MIFRFLYEELEKGLGQNGIGLQTSDGIFIVGKITQA